MDLVKQALKVNGLKDVFCQNIMTKMRRGRSMSSLILFL